MNHPMAGPIMNQRIFSMDLDVETVSLYLLCCALADAGAQVTRSALVDKWNSEPEALDQGITRLLEKRILSVAEDKGQEDTIYRITEEKQWR